MNRLRSYMALQGYNQTTLAEALEISHSVLSQKLSGRVQFSQRQIKALIRILHIPLSEVGVIFFSDDVGSEPTQEDTHD